MLLDIKNGKTDFEMLFTTPELLPKLKIFGKILGPRGLMPNAKVGTLVSDKEMFNSIERAKAGQVNYRVDSGKNIHAPIGKITFTDEQLMVNLKSLIESLTERKPAGLKTKYFIKAFVKSTMGPRWKLNMEEIDPRSTKNIWSLIKP